MRLLPLVAATALVAAVAGCGSGGDSTAPTTSSTTPSDAAAVAYMDKVCTATASFASVPRTPPQIDPNDPAKGKADMAAYMGQMAEAFNQPATKLREVGPSPVAGGDQQVEQMATTFAGIAKNFTDAKAALEAADANDPVGGLQAAGEAITRLDELVAPLKQLESVPELAAAAEKAAACQDLRTLKPSESTTPTS
ncbi:hypothetical protein [Saccharothrix sp. NRRL B-16348]|jgi:hypothetical protein|uniref:hypothetical protein n=1 Tax=Saccharothrix sp. NRRL B-16348 TaxID=1415542 RepID=UPI000AFE3875|nr:hypothetical protein [Saccharothrix sp. NRRL B-16348]